MDGVRLIKYMMAIQGLSNLKVSFEPPDGQVLISYTNRDGRQTKKITFSFEPPDGHVLISCTNRDGRQTKNITFAELFNLLTTSNLSRPAASPG